MSAVAIALVNDTFKRKKKAQTYVQYIKFNKRNSEIIQSKTPDCLGSTAFAMFVVI